ncbi:MAG TPA: hypothetical protein VM871_08400 [Flavisolibacter sp.]|nr:hypothetical protein [Flavisolibacter sp.]
MVISDDIFAMLLTHEKFGQFTSKKIADAGATTEVLICLSSECKKAVTSMVGKALATRTIAASEPVDYGFMFSRSFRDLDGQIEEVMSMDETAMQQQRPSFAKAILS